MRLLHEAGGVTTTILDDRMQRAPAFIVRERARGARAFGEWLDEHFDEIKAAAETTTRTGKLQDIEQYSAARHPLHALQLHDRRRGGPEPDRQGDAGRVPWIVEQLPGHRALLPRVELRDRQEELAGQHAAHPRQARRRRGDDPRRADRARHALDQRAACSARARSPTSAASCRASTTTAPTRPTASRDVHRHRPGRRQRRRVLGRIRLRRAARERRLLLLASRSRR